MNIKLAMRNMDGDYSFKNLNYLLFFIILISLSNYANSQIDNLSSDCTYYFDSIVNRKIYTFVDEMPVFDNKTSFLVNLVSSLEIDSLIKMNDTKGVVSFIIETDGKTTNIKIIDSINKSIDERVIDFIEKTKKWKCGYCNKKPVPVELKIPYRIEF